MDILEKIKNLPVDKQKEVEDFVDSILAKNETIDIAELIEKRKKNLDHLKGKIWMADDFNDTPEEFKEYL